MDLDMNCPCDKCQSIIPHIIGPDPFNIQREKIYDIGNYNSITVDHADISGSTVEAMTAYKKKLDDIAEAAKETERALKEFQHQHNMSVFNEELDGPG